MTTQTMSLMRPLTPTFQASLTPGSIFLNRKSSFRPSSKQYFHYKLDTVDSTDSPAKRRSTVNVTFNQAKNNLDPYVHASNWLPKFKDVCRGFLARQKAEELRKRHEAARTIQRAGSTHLDPWIQIFQAIKPTFKVVKTDELKKYLRECIIQIKKLNSERHFIEGQLSDVEDIMEQSYQISDSACLNVEGRRSPNIFAKLSEVRDNVNNDTFLKECLDLDIDGVTNVEVCFDPSSIQNSKVHTVYELADKLQQKIHEDRHKWKNLQERCQHLEQEITDIRITNGTLDTTTKMLRGMVNKNDIILQDQRDKVEEYVSLLEKLNQEKKNFLTKIKEHERALLSKEEVLMETSGKCEYFESELEKKTKVIEAFNQEKIRHVNRTKELEDKLNYNLEYQTELESTIDTQKTRLADLKRRLSSQLKTTEEELMQTINDTKIELQEQNELLESQNEKIKQYEMTMRRLEHEIDEVKHKDASDEEIDYERERQLSQQLKTATANLETMKEEMKIMESSHDELKKRVRELEESLDKANDETTEHKILIERLKSEVETKKSALGEIELRLTRANRERNFNSQKWVQAKERNADLESEISTIKEELSASIQNIAAKNKEIEVTEKEFSEAKKEQEQRINLLQKTLDDLQRRMDQQLTISAQKAEEFKKNNKMYEYKIEELQQYLEEKEIEIEQLESNKLDHNKSLKKLQRRIDENEEIQSDNQRTITKLKDQLKSLQDENESQWNMLPKSGVTSPTDQQIFDLQARAMSRSSSSITSSSSNPNDGYFTLPNKRTGRQ